MPVNIFNIFDDPSASPTPNGSGTLASGINSTDQIVGEYVNGTSSHGFLLSGGTYTTIDDPSAVNETEANGINDAGQIVGDYRDSSLMQHGFLYSNGTYTTLDDPSANSGTVAQGINALDQIVGYYLNITGIHGFVRNPNDGTYTRIDDPLGNRATFANGINDAGQIVGYYRDASGREHGFLYSAGVYTTIDDPLATGDNRATGINSAGQIVGFYDNDTGRHGFVYSGGLFTTLDKPSAFRTIPIGINSSGHVVGVLSDTTGNQSFLEVSIPNPPPPSGTTADMILRGSNTSPAVVGPVRNLRHRQQRDLVRELLRPGRNRLGVRHAWRLFRQRYDRHVVAQRQDRRFRVLRHQQ
jgi:probable HAF family extracellular repeat protein